MKILFVSYMVLSAWASDSSSGLAEQNFLYSWMQSPRFLSECIAGRGCSGYTPAQLRRLRDLARDLARDGEQLSHITFKDPSDVPGFFDEDGRVLAFKSPTGDKNYFINRSVLYVPSGESTRPLTVPEVLPLVFSILAHSRLQMGYDDSVRFFHYFRFNPARLSEQLVISRGVETIPVNRRPHIATWLFSGSGNQEVTDLVVTDFEKAHRIVCTAGLICRESDSAKPEVELMHLNTDSIQPAGSGFDVILSAYYAGGSKFGRVQFLLRFDGEFRLASWLAL
jgi:hypothetical protein